MRLDIGTILLLTKINTASSGLRSILFLIMKKNCPKVKSLGTRNLFLSMLGALDERSLSTITGTLSGYFSLIRLASSVRFFNVKFYLNESILYLIKLLFFCL